MLILIFKIIYGLSCLTFMGFLIYERHKIMGLAQNPDVEMAMHEEGQEWEIVVKASAYENLKRKYDRVFYLCIWNTFVLFILHLADRCVIAFIWQ